MKFDASEPRPVSPNLLYKVIHPLNPSVSMYFYGNIRDAITQFGFAAEYFEVPGGVSFTMDKVWSGGE